MTRSFALFFALFFPLASYALPINSVGFRALTIPDSLTADYDFEGIVALSNCSGSLVRLENSADTDKALVLTNGHCLETGMPGPGTFVSHQPSSRSFNLMGSNAQTLARLHASEVLYSSMTRTDMTLYRVTETYGEILSKYHVHALTLSSQHPKETTPIEVISGYWQRGYTCTIQKFVTHLKEDAWTWDDSIRYQEPGCETIGGTSGSPIVQAGTRTVIGVNNTGNENGQKCTMDNPCEVDDKGVVVYEQGASYGQQTFWVYSCLNAARDLDLSIKGCQLFH